MSSRNRVWATSAARAEMRALAAEVAAIVGALEFSSSEDIASALGAIGERLLGLAGPERTKPAADTEDAA